MPHNSSAHCLEPVMDLILIVSSLFLQTKRTDNGIQEINGIKNGAISTGNEVISEEKQEKNNTTASSRQKTAVVRDSVKSNPDTTSPDLMHRVLPPPPEKLQATPPVPELEDPLYDTVKDIKEREDGAPSSKKDTMKISTTIEASASEKQERINPLYVSADEIKDFPSNQETSVDVPSGEAQEKATESTEPLYAVVNKKPSVKKPPAENPGEEKSKFKDLTLQNVVLQEEPKSDNPTVDFIPSMEKKPLHPQSPSTKLNSMLSHWNKKSVKHPTNTTLNLSREVPPLVPVKQSDIESEPEQHTIQDDTAITIDLPTST